jgi:hypothetical protein
MRVLKYAGVLALAAAALAAQQESGWRKVEQSKGDQPQLSDGQIQDIITRFAAKESEFARARENYTYRQNCRLLDLDPGGGEVGRWEMVTDVIFSPDGKRTEHVVRAPVQSLKNFQLTPEDETDLRNVQPFVLTTEQLPKYLIRYLGKQNVDEIPCYMFAVKPKKLEKGQRYFEGQVWVDDRDLQIVKSYGRGIGIVGKGNAFPKFETYREQIDGKYWFPTYTRADDVLYFPDSQARIRMLVKYENYKQFKTETSIQFGGEASPGHEQKSPQPDKKP